MTPYPYLALGRRDGVGISRDVYLHRIVLPSTPLLHLDVRARPLLQPLNARTAWSLELTHYLRGHPDDRSPGPKLAQLESNSVCKRFRAGGGGGGLQGGGRQPGVLYSMRLRFIRARTPRPLKTKTAGEKKPHPGCTNPFSPEHGRLTVWRVTLQLSCSSPFQRHSRPNARKMLPSRWRRWTTTTGFVCPCQPHVSPTQHPSADTPTSPVTPLFTSPPFPSPTKQTVAPFSPAPRASSWPPSPPPRTTLCRGRPRR